MHIPDMMITGAVCPATGALAAVGLAGAAYAAYKTKIKPAAALFAGVTAMIFAAQMTNFPIFEGTSGHLLGATLAVVLLGSAFGIMAMSLVVITQCLIFADGGISVLGANLLNIALLASLPAVLVRELLFRESLSTVSKNTMYVTAAFLSTLVAATACAVQLAIAGVSPLQTVLPAMLYYHVLIALAEAGLTLALLVIFAQVAAKVAPQRAWIVPLGFAAVVAVLISPFGSGSPDGLMSAAGALGFAHLAGEFFVAPVDYVVSAVSSEALATAIAGFIGIALVFAVAYGTGRAFARSEKRSM